MQQQHISSLLVAGVILTAGSYAHACGKAASAPEQKCTCSPMSYPEAAVRAEAEGTTVVEFTVDGNGKVASSSIVQSSGESREHKLLDQTARELLATCTFLAARSTEVQGKKLKVEY